MTHVVVVVVGDWSAGDCIEAFLVKDKKHKEEKEVL